MNVTVLTGGSTPERDVALAGAGQVVRALRSQGHHVVAIDTTSGILCAEDEAARLSAGVDRSPPDADTLGALRARELGPRLLALEPVKHADVVFLALHGRDAEGGAMQAMLDMAGVTYTGSGALGSAVAMDKDIAKRLMRAAGIATPDWCMWPAALPAIEPLGLPLVVKPSKVGSTVGLTIVESLTELPGAVERALQYDDEVLLEAFVDGPELTVGILGNEALAVGEIRPAHAVFDYECKYTPGMCEELFPAPLDPGVTGLVRSTAARAHMALKLRDYSRVDFRVGPGDIVYCLEANTLPGLTTTSLLPQSAAAAGTGFQALCERIVQAAAARSTKRNNVLSLGIN